MPTRSTAQEVRDGIGFWVVNHSGVPVSGPFGDYPTAHTEAARLWRSRVGDLPSNYIRFGTKDEVTY